MKQTVALQRRSEFSFEKTEPNHKIAIAPGKQKQFCQYVFQKRRIVRKKLKQTPFLLGDQFLLHFLKQEMQIRVIFSA